jgi:uncharacterized protein
MSDLGQQRRERRQGRGQTEGQPRGKTADSRAAVAIAAGHAYIHAMSTAGPPKPCVICGKPQAERLSPFCSRRCADVDLHRWMAAVYAIPAQEEDPDDPPGDPARDAGPTRDTGES